MQSLILSKLLLTLDPINYRQISCITRWRYILWGGLLTLIVSFYLLNLQDYLVPNLLDELELEKFVEGFFCWWIENSVINLIYFICTVWQLFQQLLQMILILGPRLHPSLLVQSALGLLKARVVTVASWKNQKQSPEDVQVARLLDKVDFKKLFCQSYRLVQGHLIESSQVLLFQRMHRRAFNLLHDICRLKVLGIEILLKEFEKQSWECVSEFSEQKSTFTDYFLILLTYSRCRSLFACKLHSFPRFFQCHWKRKLVLGDELMIKEFVSMRALPIHLLHHAEDFRKPCILIMIKSHCLN